MSEYELARLEREADRALYGVDPEFARELGYQPPPPPSAPDPELSRRFREFMANGARQAPDPFLMLQMTSSLFQQQAPRRTGLLDAIGFALF